MKKIFYTLALCLLLTGCYTQRFPISARNVAYEPTHSEMKIFLLWGLALQPQYTDPAQICGGLNNVAVVETKMSFIDGLIGALTFGIITPQTANVYCLNNGRYQTRYQQMPTSFVYPNGQNQNYQPQYNGKYQGGYAQQR